MTTRTALLLFFCACGEGELTVDTTYSSDDEAGELEAELTGAPSDASLREALGPVRQRALRVLTGDPSQRATDSAPSPRMVATLAEEHQRAEAAFHRGAIGTCDGASFRALDDQGRQTPNRQCADKETDLGSCLKSHFEATSRLARAALMATDDSARSRLLTRADAALQLGLCQLQPRAAEINWFKRYITIADALARTELFLSETAKLHPGEGPDTLVGRRKRAVEVLRSTLAAGAVPQERDPYGAHWMGTNLMWRAQAAFWLGLATGDLALLRGVRRAVNQTLSLKSGNAGIQRDFSYHFHSSINPAVANFYSGGYGGAHALAAARYLWLTEGTSLEPPLAGNLYQELLEGMRWMLHRGHTDPSVSGRNQTFGANGAGNEIFGALMWLSLTREPRFEAARDRLRGSLLSHLDADRAFFAAGLGNPDFDAPRLLLPRINAQRPGWSTHDDALGFKSFPDSDYAVFRDPHYFASVKMLSTRILSGEKQQNGHNLGARQSDGRLNLALAGNEYARRNISQSLDWRRLPGITTSFSEESADAFLVSGPKRYQYSTGARGFTGGTGDAQGGVAAMRFATRSSLLSGLDAQKAYFFFPGVVAVTASGVTCSNCPGPLQTVVQQWPFAASGADFAFGRPSGTEGVLDREPAAARDLDARWLWADGIGYVFPGRTALRVKRDSLPICEERVSARTTPGVAPHTMKCPADAPKQRYLTVWHDHTAERSNSFAWVALPGATRADTAAWASAPRLVLRNEGEVATADYGPGEQLGAVFWSAAANPAVTWGPVGSISVDRPALLHLVAHDSGVRLQLSAALHARLAVTVKLGKRLLATPGGCLQSAANVGETTTLSLQLSGGRTCTVELHPTTAPRAAVAEEEEPGVAAPDDGLDGSPLELEPEAFGAEL